ncbi:IS3 family transposase, partial [Pediococcus argentinicus]
MKKQHRLAYHAIKEVSQGQHGAITKLLKLIGVSRQAYYKGLRRKETTWEQQNQKLKERVQYWFDIHKQGIGAGLLVDNLLRDEQVDVPISLKRVRRVMRELNIRCQVRRKKHNRVKQEEQYVQDNVLNQQFTVTAPNQVWLSDSTELAYGVNGEHKIRLSGVLDLYGRRMMSYYLSPTETAEAE